LQPLRRGAHLLFQGVGAIEILLVLQGLHLVLQALDAFPLLPHLDQQHHKQHSHQGGEAGTGAAHPGGQGGLRAAGAHGAASDPSSLERAVSLGEAFG
jgi:hypothetical protein